jgi:hypothetical protein
MLQYGITRRRVREPRIEAWRALAAENLWERLQSRSVWPEVPLSRLKSLPLSVRPERSAAESKGRWHTVRLRPFDFGPMGLRSGRTVGWELDLTPVLRLRPCGPTFRANGWVEARAHSGPSTPTLRAYAQGERLDGSSISLRPFDSGPAGLRSGRTVGLRFGVTPVLRLAPFPRSTFHQCSHGCTRAGSRTGCAPTYRVICRRAGDQPPALECFWTAFSISAGGR